MVGDHLEPEHRVDCAVALGPLSFPLFAQLRHLLRGVSLRVEFLCVAIVPGVRELPVSVQAVVAVAL